MNSLYFDRQGQRIDVDEWSRLAHTPGYKTVNRSRVGGAEVSTVWLGLDHATIGQSAALPVIFETMVFGAPDDDHRMRRYCTEADARAGHTLVVAEVERARRPLARLRRAVTEAVRTWRA